MMRARYSRGIGLGAGVLLLAIAAAWVATRDRPDSIVTALLYPEFGAQMQTAQRVQLFTAGDTLAVELVRESERWTVTQRDGYTADVGKIGVLLQDVAELKIIEAKTSEPSNYAALGLEDTNAADAQGMRLLVTGAGSETLVNLIIGKRAAGMEATYVRKSGERPSWLVSRLDPARLPGAWLSQLVLHIDTDRIQQVTLRLRGQPEFSASKAARVASDFVPVGKPLSPPSAANGLAAALIAVEAEDVRRADSLPSPTPAATATYRMFDGLELKLTGWIEDSQHWVAVTPSFDAALAARFANEKPAGNSTNAYSRTPEQARQEAERLTARLTGWAYRLPAYRYDSIFPDPEKWR